MDLFQGVQIMSPIKSNVSEQTRSSDHGWLNDEHKLTRPPEQSRASWKCIDLRSFTDHENTYETECIGKLGVPFIVNNRQFSCTCFKLNDNNE